MSKVRSEEDRRQIDRRVEQQPKNEPIAVERRGSENRSGKDRRA